MDDRAPRISKSWLNPHGVLMCDHDEYPTGILKRHIQVIGDYGNTAWVCHSCLRVVHRELTPTSL
jgi:hypothetical protein